MAVHPRGCAGHLNTVFKWLLDLPSMVSSSGIKHVDLFLLGFTYSCWASWALSMVASISSSLSHESSSLSLNCAGVGTQAFKALARVVPLPKPAGEPTDMGLSAQDVHPNPLPETFPPGAQENPVLFLGEPGARPRRALSCSVTGGVQVLEPRSEISLASTFRIEMSKGAIDMGSSSAKCSSVLGPANPSCELDWKLGTSGSNTDSVLSSSSRLSFSSSSFGAL